MFGSRIVENHYECITICLDDLLIASKDPHCVADALTNNHHFKLKDIAPLFYHLGCNFGSDGDRTLHFAPRKCIEKMEEYYLSVFGSKPKQIYMLQLEKGCHPELDTSKYLNQDGI